MIPKALNRTFPPWALARLNRALSPLGVAVPVQRSKQSVLEDNAYQAEVTAVRHETSRAVTIEFELLEGYRLNYKSGQYVMVNIPIGPVLFQRCYSFSSAPYEARYAITVQQVFNGRIASFFKQQLRIGDRFYIEDPAGDFVLPDLRPEDQRYLFIAGGIGIVPIYALIKDLLSKNPNVDIQLVYASRTEDQGIFLKEMQKWSREYPGFSMRTQFTRRSDLGHDPYRRLDGHKIISRVSDPTSAFTYVSGPYGLLRKCSEAFETLGIPKSRIRIENFNVFPKSRVADALRPHSISFLPSSPLVGKLSRIRQPQIETLLDSARRAGITLPQKCSTGSCGSCKVRVKAGMVVADEPNMLSVDDASEGYVLACMSYPCESLVVKLSGKR